MIRCRYVGEDSCEVAYREFNAVGQAADFSERQFAEIVLGGGCFIPDSEFKKIGFTTEEIAAYGPTENRDEATTAFLEKVYLAQQVFRDLHSRIAAEGSSRFSVFEVSGIESDGEQVEA